MQNKIHYYRIGLCFRPFVARDNRWLLSRVQRLAGPAGDRGLLSLLETPTGTKGGPFVPVGGSNRDKRPAYQPGQKALAPLSPSLSPRPSHSAHLFSGCSWLGREEFLLISSPHLWRSLIPRPSIGAKGLGLVFLFFLGLKVWGLFFSSSLAYIAHFML